MARHRATGRKRRIQRVEVKRILVVTEGIRTEPQYVELLNGYLRSRNASTAVHAVGAGKDPLKVVEKCMRLRDDAASKEKDYDVFVCLVDVDQHAALSKAVQLARRESILLLVSNLKFEVWLRWHVENKRSVLNSSELDSLMEKLNLVKNKALTPDFPFGSVDFACDIARSIDPGMSPGRIGPDPSSAMPILVDLMRGE